MKTLKLTKYIFQFSKRVYIVQAQQDLIHHHSFSTNQHHFVLYHPRKKYFLPEKYKWKLEID